MRPPYAARPPDPAMPFRIVLSAHSWWNKQSKKISLYQAKQSLTISPFKISELRLPFLSTGNNCSAGSLSEQQ
jgi:hypothetical protein